MLYTEAFGLLIGAVALGAIHGVEPGHGWPVTATYALNRTNEWFYGLVSSFILGVGHLLSSLIMVAVFFYANHTSISPGSTNRLRSSVGFRSAAP